MTEEKAEEGKVKWSVYVHYAKAIGVYYTVGGILFTLAYQGFQVRTDET